MVTEVVAALIWDEGRFMICQRPEGKARGLLWEFVGGKVEMGERLLDEQLQLIDSADERLRQREEALVRECKEELAVTVEAGDVYMEVVHEYPDMTVRLTLFEARIVEGVPQKLEHNDIRWIAPDEIDEYDFCPADVEILERLRS